MPSLELSRRALLRGLGGVAVALPMLEIMQGSTKSAWAAPPPKRYLFAYCGISVGSWLESGAWQGNHLIPSTVGPGYSPKDAFASLETRGVTSDVSVVTGLKIPWDTGGGVPAGGRVVNFHGNSVQPQITGNRVAASGDDPVGPSSDQLVADAIAGGTTHRLLSYRVEADTSGFGTFGCLSFRSDGPEAAIESPRLAYESLFTGFTPPDPTQAAQAQQVLRRRQSVLDIVRGDVERLLPRLGAWDRQRMQRHFEEIRALETRLDAIPPTTSATCYMPPHPGDDPTVGDPVYTGDNLGYSAHANYSHEDERAPLFVDLIHMAFACDLSRVATLQFNRWKSYLNMLPLTGAMSDLHELTHGAGSGADLARAIDWHVDHYAQLVSKLKGTPDGLGGSLLDHTAMVMAFEGGQGFDPEGGDPIDGHSTENMAMLIAGRAGGLNAGQHVACNNTRHPAHVVASAMKAVGAGETLGEVSGTVPELFV